MRGGRRAIRQGMEDIVRGDKWTAVILVAMIGSALAIPALAEEPAPPAEKPATSVDASDPTKGFVTFKSGDNSLTLGAWGQFRITVDDKDEYDNDTAGT